MTAGRRAFTEFADALHQPGGSWAHAWILRETCPLIWDEEWGKNLVDAAMDRVKKRVAAGALPDFYLGVVKELGAAQVARTLGASAAQVYLVKHAWRRR